MDLCLNSLKLCEKSGMFATSPGGGMWGASGRALTHLSPQIPRFLQTAEMVKPSTPSPSHESSSSSGSDEGTEYYPHLGEKLSRGQRSR